MTDERYKEIDIRLRKVEDFIIGQLAVLIELSQSLKSRVEELESHDIECMNMIHHSCTLKDKEITKAQATAIAESKEYTSEIHKQTLSILAGMFLLFIGAVVYFNDQIQTRALASQRNTTNIDGIIKSLDKIDDKLDSLAESISRGK